MSNHEIEDVLSSIRRLVSEDLRPSPKSEATAEVQAPEPKPAPVQAAAKLLLTPSLRVIDEPTEDAPLAEEDDQSPMLAAEASDDDRHMAFTATEDDVLQEDSDAFSVEPEDDVQDVVSRLGAAVGDADEDWESPVGDPPAWEEVSLSDSQSGETTHGRLHFRPTSEDDAEEVMATSTEFETPDHFASDFSDEDDFAEAEEPAAAAPRRVVNPPTDGWAEAAEAEVRAELERDLEDSAESMFAGSEVTFDEEVLRDLVRDIIREELAGTLGERITRNVRKLVRAEIARALAVREFE